MNTKKCIIVSTKLHTKIDQFFSENNLKWNYRRKQTFFFILFHFVFYCSVAAAAVVWGNSIPNFRWGLFSFWRIESCSLMDDMLYIRQTRYLNHIKNRRLIRSKYIHNRLTTDIVFVDLEISFVFGWWSLCGFLKRLLKLHSFWMASKREGKLPKGWPIPNYVFLNGDRRDTWESIYKLKMTIKW